MAREPVAIFPLFTKVRFTGHARFMMQSRSGALSLKFLMSRKSGASARRLRCEGRKDRKQ